MPIDANSGLPAKPAVSLFGFNYDYHTDTDDEHKYVTALNRKFLKFNKTRKEAYVIKLWRTCHNKAFVCGCLINQFYGIRTKMSYFGRQMISHDIYLKQKAKNQDTALFIKHINPTGKFKRLWDYGQLILIIYAATYSPYKTAFMQ